jgi:hypothetical protein
MASPAVSKAPPKLGSKTNTPAKARKGSGSSVASKPSTTQASPNPKSLKKGTTPRKLSQKAPEPIEDDEVSVPETPSPKSKKKTASSEQRRPISPPDDAASQASGSAAPLGRAASGLTGKAKGLAGGAAGKVKDAAGEGAESIQNGAKEATEKLPGTDGLPSLDNLPVPFDLSALKGLEVSEGGNILGADGNPLGQVVEGDPEDLVGQTVGDDGEIVDEDGDLIGRVDILHDLAEKAQNVPDEAQSKLGDVENVVTDLAQLEGLPVSDGGVIKNSAGQIVGRIVEGDWEDLIGYTLNEEGEIVDDEGDAIGRVDLVPVEEQKKVIEDAANDATDKVDGAKDDAEDQFEDAQDNLPTDQAKGAVEGVADEAEGAVDDAQDNVSDVDYDDVPDVDEAKNAAEGVVGDAKSTAEDAQGDLEDTAEGAKDTLDETADDAEGAAEDGKIELEDNVNGVKDNAEDTAEGVEGDLEETAEDTKDTAEDAAEGVEGELEDAKDTAEDAAEDVAEDLEQRVPSLDTLEGLSCNKRGYIINEATGKPVGELIEGDAKKIAKLGATLDDKGQFWDNRGNVIGQAKALPIEEDDSEEGPFSGLEGLVVNEDGYIEDENSTRVGRLIEGDAKKLSGRGVDEDGEILDRKGNVIGRAERLEEEPEEPEEAAPDLSALNGLTCNKAGYVIGPEGYPIGRVVEGNPKELAGKKIEDGEIYDGKKVIGRVELIPEDEIDSKSEGPFAGMDSLVVTKDGFVEDDEGSIVGQLVEGDPKKLRGRAVDEDGEITDKYGNVKGRAEPYEPPEEEAPEEEDLSILEGKVVNKSGNVVDPATGAVVGRVVEGDKRLAGCKVDGKGQIWGDNGKVVGRAELIPGGEQNKVEGPFFGFDNAVVGKDGVVTSGDKIIGRLIEGDPKRLLGRSVDEDGDVADKNGNTIGKAERWEPEEKKRDINPMAGRKVNKEGEVRDADGNLIGKLTAGNLATLVGKTIDDNGFVVDNDGNKLGECTLLENIPEPEPEPEEEEEGPTAEELEAQAKAEEDRKLAEKMCYILRQTLESVKPVCKQITDVSSIPTLQSLSTKY